MFKSKKGYLFIAAVLFVFVMVTAVMQAETSPGISIKQHLPKGIHLNNPDGQGDYKVIIKNLQAEFIGDLTIEIGVPDGFKLKSIDKVNIDQVEYDFNQDDLKLTIEFPESMPFGKNKELEIDYILKTTKAKIEEYADPEIKITSQKGHNSELSVSEPVYSLLKVSVKATTPNIILWSMT